MRPVMKPESDTRIIRLRRAGMSYAEIGRVVGLSRQRVAQRLDRHGLCGPSSQSPQARAVLKAFDKKLSTREIAETARVSYATARDVMKRHSLKPAKSKIKGPGNKVSKEAAIAYMKRLAKKLKRTPSAKDMTRSAGPSHLTYYRIFGSWPKAVRAAGLKPQRPSYSRERK